MIVRNPLGGDLLIGALLDRLGSVQAQALLARLKKSLCENERDSYPKSIERRRERLCYPIESETSRTSKETQP